jgi:hypothetical protein
MIGNEENILKEGKNHFARPVLQGKQAAFKCEHWPEVFSIERP